MMLKRTIICILSVLVLTAMFPMSVFGAEVSEQAEAADDTGIVIELPPVFYSEEEPLDNDGLFAKYVESRLSVGDSAGYGKALLRQARLTGVNAVIYEILRQEIALVANGTNSSTSFTIPVEDLGLEKLFFTPEELGVEWVYDGYSTINQKAIDALFNDVLELDLGKIHDALLYNCPYDLYWFDKTSGVKMSTPYVGVRYFIDDYALYITGSIDMDFEVADGYSAGKYKVNTENAERVQHAVDKAAAIVREASGLMDHEKLVYYKEAICDLVTYDYSALDSSVLYGDPWQVISVFDENTDTNVVCEGYSKAFKYLCDLTDFSGDISCITPIGVMRGGTGAGNHMWNIVTMEDGQNYLVDLTNCDDGSVGAPDYLFMRGAASGSVDTSYTFGTYYGSISYTYSSDMKDIFDTELELSMKDYAANETEYAEDGLTYHLVGKEAILTGYEGTPSQVIIPEEVSGCRVVRIDPEAFKNCSSLEKLYIPLSIRVIGAKAFEGTSLSEIFYEGDFMQWLNLTYGSSAIPSGTDYTCEAMAEEGHVFLTDYITESYANCTEDGISKRKCVMCGEVLTKVEPKLGHDWAEWTVGKEATCTEDGIKSRSCARCGRKETVTIEALGHTEVLLPAKDPTCTASGLTEGKKCSVCGEILNAQKTVPALGHDWSEWIVVKEATPLEEGLEKRACSRCNKEETRSIPKVVVTGWVDGDDGYRYYFDNNGSMVTGWKKIDGYWYYFEPKNSAGQGGHMRTNVWKKDSKGWCYLGPDGKMVANGWAKDSKGWCWIGSDGYMVEKTQWIKYDGGWYYIEKGYRIQNAWRKDSKGWCYLGPEGRMVTNDFVKDSKGWCWIGSAGYMVEKTQWLKVGDDWYYINKGYRVQNTWKKDSKGWCYLGSDGRMVTNGWAKDSKGWCWIAGDGYMPEINSWIDYEGDRYYILKGYRVDNKTIEIDGVEYTFDKDGKLVP